MSTQSHFFVGNLTRDPESRHVASGDLVANFCVAVNGRSPEDTVYFECEVWGKTAELVMKFFKKGKPIVVLDAIARQETWMDKTSGENRSRLKFKVSRVGFVSGGKNEGVDEVSGPEPEVETKKPAVAKASPKNSLPKLPVNKDVDLDDEDSIPF